MKVICIKPTKRLVKNFAYEAVQLWNDGTNARWIEGNVEISGMGRFVVTNFRDTSGNPLPKINIKKQVSSMPENSNFSDLSVGDILVCRSDSYKSLLEGGYYRIENLIKKSDRSYGNLVKFEGIKRSLIFSPWRFRKLSAEESREMSLNSLLNNEEPNIIKSVSIRKIDLIKNKEEFLIDILAKSIGDKSRHHLSIVEWACEKIGSKMGIVPADFDCIIDMPLGEILKFSERK